MDLELFSFSISGRKEHHPDGLGVTRDRSRRQGVRGTSFLIATGHSENSQVLVNSTIRPPSLPIVLLLHA